MILIPPNQATCIVGVSGHPTHNHPPLCPVGWLLRIAEWNGCCVFWTLRRCRADSARHLLFDGDGEEQLASGLSQRFRLAQDFTEDKRLPGSTLLAQLLDDGVRAIPAA